MITGCSVASQIARKCAEHRVVVRPEQVVHRRHLQRRDTEASKRLAAADRIARAVDDDAGDHRHPAVRLLDHRRYQALQLVRIERVALARAAARREPMHAAIQEPAHLRAHRRLVDLAVRIERRGHRRNDPEHLLCHASPPMRSAASVAGTSIWGRCRDQPSR
jgi:hypothetical protein